MKTRAGLIPLLAIVVPVGCIDPLDRPDTTFTSFGGGETGSETMTTESPTGGQQSATASATDGATESTGGGATEATESGTEVSATASSEGSSGGGPGCGDGNVEGDEECDDANDVDTDECPSTCVMAACGDGFVQAGVEDCDDANAVNEDGCLATCVTAACGDGFVQDGIEVCDDANADDTDACLASCVAASCGDGHVQVGVESCDDGNGTPGDGCNACLAECGNPGGGSTIAENGTGSGEVYCYEVGDTVETRASKACESHFGVGACCIIPGGYNGLQYGQCGADGTAGTIHWHPDAHPEGHCDPLYVVGDVVSPGWCGVILGNFLD
jgi:cysteine-rich repeat protein